MWEDISTSVSGAQVRRCSICDTMRRPGWGNFLSEQHALVPGMVKSGSSGSDGKPPLATRMRSHTGQSADPSTGSGAIHGNRFFLFVGCGVVFLWLLLFSLCFLFCS